MSIEHYLMLSSCSQLPHEGTTTMHHAFAHKKAEVQDTYLA